MSAFGIIRRSNVAQVKTLEHNGSVIFSMEDGKDPFSQFESEDFTVEKAEEDGLYRAVDE